MASAIDERLTGYRRRSRGNASLLVRLIAIVYGVLQLSISRGAFFLASKVVGNETMDRITASGRLAVGPQQCQFAIAAADHGSIRQAAELRSVQHSILNRSIRRFEHRIRVTVFIAQRRGCDTADCFD